jgi:hypothetical protein
MSTPPQDKVICALIGQVADAVPPSGNEQDVITHISRPMWNLWCRAVGEPEHSTPSPQWSLHGNRVYGSRTIIVESDEYFAVSRSIL